jgi:histone acetyltransferase (RNA polymerase elongator complex component)
MEKKGVPHYIVVITPPAQYDTNTGKPKSNFQKPYEQTFNHIEILDTIMHHNVVSDMAVMEIVSSPFGAADMKRKNAFIKRVSDAQNIKVSDQKAAFEKIAKDYKNLVKAHNAEVDKFAAKQEKEAKNV